LCDVLLPALYHGVPVLAHRSKFEPLSTIEMMRKHHVRHTFMPPTALKRMRQATNLYKTRFLVSVGAGGEGLGDKLMEWGREMLGVTINEFYGQTEANLLIGNCSRIMRVKPGSMGRAIPGHNVDIVDDKGNVVPTGQIGHIAVKAPDPVVFLQYWKNKKATEEKFRGDWCVTGDLGRKDSDGYFWFVGRDDDLINSSGYRIGPGEVENTLLKHKDVSMAAVIGVPDPMRGEIVKAFVVLRDSVEPKEELKTEIQQFVKTQLAAHEYPRQLEFVKALPMTHTGKILRRTLRNQEIEKLKERQGDADIGSQPNLPPPIPNSAPPQSS
jgi:acetyl-CoA synthetase